MKITSHSDLSCAKDNVEVALTGDLINHGTISGQRVKLTADNLVNQAGTIHGADVTLQARTDITSTGGLLSATHSLLAAAGRDITLTSPTVSTSRQDSGNSYDRTTIQRTSGLQVTGDGGQLQLAAGRDITLTAAQVNNQAANSQTWLTAGNDLILNTVTTAARDHLVWDKDNWLSNATTQQNGSTLSGGGKLTLQAGHDLSATAATVSAGQGLAVAAGNDIHLSAGINTTDYEEHQRHSGSNGAFSSTTTTTADQLHQQQAQGTLLSGDTVTLQAGRDLTLTGSDTVGEHQVSLAAGRDLLLTTTAEHSSESHLTQEKHSGLSGSGGVGFTYGSQSQKVTDTAQTISQHGSTVGATQGDVILHAGDVLTVNGSTGEVKLSDLIGSAVIGGITAGKGYNPTVTWNAAGGYYQAQISGDDPFMAALVGKAGASAGYAVGNVIKVPMDKVLNPVSKQYEWIPTGVWTITRPAPQSSVPSIMGNLGDTFVSGVTGDVLQKTKSGDKNETK